MLQFWEKGALFVKDLLQEYDEPKPHINTLSTMVRSLEARGFLSHNAYGNTYQYYPIVSKKEFHKNSLKNVIVKYFNNSPITAISSLIEEEHISTDELKELIAMIEKGKEK